jgi:hypothetical protein
MYYIMSVQTPAYTPEPDPLVINGAWNRGLIGGQRRGVASWHPLVTSRHYPRFSSSRLQ